MLSLGRSVLFADFELLRRESIVFVSSNTSVVLGTCRRFGCCSRGGEEIMHLSRFAVGLQGLGDGTTCPSAEQLAGTQDCTDPCQAPYPPCSSGAGATYTTVTTTQGDYQVLSNGQIVDPNGNPVTQAQLTQVLASTSITPAQLSNIKNYYYSQGQLSPSAAATGTVNLSTSTLWIGGAAVGLLVILMLASGGGGRRR